MLPVQARCDPLQNPYPLSVAGGRGSLQAAAGLDPAVADQAQVNVKTEPPTDGDEPEVIEEGEKEIITPENNSGRHLQDAAAVEEEHPRGVPARSRRLPGQGG